MLGYVPGLGSDDEGDDGDEERDTRKLIMEHNRKKKKSGGFQSMGQSECNSKYITLKLGQSVTVNITLKLGQSECNSKYNTETGSVRV